MEQFFQSHQYTIQAISATATCIAVITSLVMSWKALHTKKKAFRLSNLSAGSTIYFEGEEMKKENQRIKDRYFAFNIENLLEHNLELFEATVFIEYEKQGQGQIFSLSNLKVSPISMQTVRVNVDEVWNRELFHKKDCKMYLEVATSFGNRKLYLSDKEFRMFKRAFSNERLEIKDNEKN